MRSALLPVLVALWSACWTMKGAGAPQAGALATASSSHHADYRVAIWYRLDRPLDTFRYQIYDLRKGQYTAAVDDWLALLRSKFPGYHAVVRDVDLASEKGATELLKVGSIIQRELLAAAASEGVFIGGSGLGPARPLYPMPRFSPAPEPIGRPFPPARGLSGTIDLNPPGPSFPVPVPYPRPHP